MREEEISQVSDLPPLRARHHAMATALCILLGYALYVLLTWATDLLLTRTLSPGHFYAADTAAQFVFTSAGAFVATHLAHNRRAVSVWMSGLGVCLGAISIISTWHDSTPHWYHIVLYCSYVPAVLCGTFLASLKPNALSPRRAAAAPRIDGCAPGTALPPPVRDRRAGEGRRQ